MRIFVSKWRWQRVEVLVLLRLLLLVMLLLLPTMMQLRRLLVICALLFPVCLFVNSNFSLPFVFAGDDEEPVVQAPQKRLEPPDELHFSLTIPDDMTALEFDTIRLAAAYGAVNGQAFEQGLYNRESGSPAFSFLLEVRTRVVLFGCCLCTLKNILVGSCTSPSLLAIALSIPSCHISVGSH